MVQVFETGPKPSGRIAEMLGMSLGQGLGTGINTYLANRSLESVLKDKSLKDAPLSQKLSKMQNALGPYGEVGDKIFQDRLQIEQQGIKEEEQKTKQRQSEVIGKVLNNKPVTDAERSILSPEQHLAVAKHNKELEGKFEDDRNYDVIKESFGDRFANLWKASTPGGRTRLMESAIQNLARDIDVKEFFDNLKSTKTEVPQEELINEKYPSQVLPQGMNAKEKVEYGSALRKENLPIYNAAVDKVKSLKGEKMLIGRANELNERRNIPEGIEKIIINPETGEPYGAAQLLGLVNTDTQSFIKTINEFTTKAKDTYGSRVTNFDLAQYMKRLPGLLNTYEGRKNILKQMELSNQITELYENALSDIYEHYGLNGISPEKANRLAMNHIAEEEARLVEEFRTIDENNEGISSRGSKQEKAPETFDELFP